MSRLGIKQPRARQVTGSIVMMDNDTVSGVLNDQDSVALKRSVTGIILHPQPQDNPNDPLNWPMWKRDLCLLIVGFQTFLGGGQSPLLAAGMNSLHLEFDKPLTTVAYLVGAFMLALGTGSVFASPTAILYGKRFVYLMGILIFFVGSIVAGAAKTFGALMAGRIITGFGASPTESLPSATIAEIYFAHERAYRVGIYTMLMLGGKNIIPLLSGLVFQLLDRHWLFWILAMFLGMNLLLTFFFVPETFWERSPTPNKRSLEETEAAHNVADYNPPERRPNAFALHRATTDNVLEVESLSSSVANTSRIAPSAHVEAPVAITEPPVQEQTPAAPKPYWKTLAILDGRHTIDSWWMVALRPFFLYSYPSVLFGSFVYSLAVVWLIVISETIAEIFHGEAYGYTQQTIGLFYISPFIGGILGSMCTGLVSDRLSRYLVSKNHGIYEPEFRLFMMIPATFFIAFGLIGYGWSAQAEDMWAGPVIFFGCLSFGSSMASTTAITFTVDSYKMFAAEALVSFNFLKNFLGFIFSIFNNAAYSARGGKNIFIAYGMVQLFVSLFGIPLYIYGKKLRSWTDRREILRRLYHEDNVPVTNTEDSFDDTHTANEEDADDSHTEAEVEDEAKSESTPGPSPDATIQKDN